MFGMRGPELLLILAVLLLLFGATRLPALGSSLGSAIRNFKKGFGGDSDSTGDEPRNPQNLSAGGDVHDAGTKSKASSRDS